MSRTVAVISVLAVLALAIGPRPPRLIWNATASAPVGLYRVEYGSALAKGSLVLAVLPPRLAALAATRGYLPVHVPLVKPIAALPGDRVCREAEAVSINGIQIARSLARDTHLRPLPRWQGCITLHPGEVFLLNPHVADSFDGRYFGAVPASSILGNLEPIWTR